MNKLYFGLGMLIGGAAGSIGTYFLVKDRFEAMADAEIEEYAEHAEKRIEAIKDRYDDKVVGDLDEEEDEEEPDPDPEENLIRNNEGVKKYHHYNGKDLPEYASQRVFTKPQDKKESEEIKKQIEENKMVKSVPEVEEINEKQFLDLEGEKQTIDVLFRYGEGKGKEEEIWGYQTDNECTCKERFGKNLIDLIGIDGEDMLDWVEADEGIAVRYFNNKALGVAFEIVVHCDADTYYENESI